MSQWVIRYGATFGKEAVDAEVMKIFKSAFTLNISCLGPKEIIGFGRWILAQIFENSS